MPHRKVHWTTTLVIVILFSTMFLFLQTDNPSIFPRTASPRAGTVLASALNVRSGPSKSYMRTGILMSGSNVVILDETSGWYRIQFGETTGYVCGDYIQLRYCECCGSEEHIAKYCPAKAIERGAIGRWKIPEVGVNVAVFNTNAQAVCDAKDSACFFAYGNGTLIADHKHQGFNAIKQCTAGMLAYIDDGIEEKAYVCTKIIQGKNTGSILTDMDGNNLAYANPNGIICYTCNNNWKNVTVVFFQPV